MYNVVLKKDVQAYNIDALNRTAVCTADVPNGSVFKLDGYSTVDGEGTVWKTAQAADTDTGLWMATSPEVVIVKDGMGAEHKGIQCDPRAFTNIAGRMIDITKLVEGDIIAMTGEGITGIATALHLVPDATDFKLKAQATAGTGFTLKKIGTERLHIGSGGIADPAVTMYKYEVVRN